MSDAIPLRPLPTSLGKLWYIGEIEFRIPEANRDETPKADDYLQITDAAEYLGVCRNTLRNWGRDGKINEYRHPINNYRLYKKAELKRWRSQLTNLGKTKPK